MSRDSSGHRRALYLRIRTRTNSAPVQRIGSAPRYTIHSIDWSRRPEMYRLTRRRP